MKLKLTQLRTVLFDLDNVLVWSEQQHFAAWQRVLLHMDYDPNIIDYTEIVGVADSQVASHLHQQYGLGQTPADLLAYKVNAFIKLCRQPFAHPAGRDNLLHTLASQYKLGLVSSSSESEIDCILSLAGLTPYFDFILAAEHCEKLKPDPWPYQKALALAQCKADEALVIEDSVSGISAAQAAGIAVIGMVAPEASAPQVPGVRYFQDFEQVHHWLMHESVIVE